MDFDQAFAKLIDVEKGFQQSTQDRGNWTGGAIGVGVCRGTKYGISASAYPGEDIEHLTLERAKELYRRDYWGPAGCDAMPPEVKFAMFDCAVNTSSPGSCKTAIRMLQRAVGEVEDGILGPHTLQAALSMHPLRLLLRLTGERHLYDCDAITWPAHGKGWTRRVANIQLEA